jgi:two-component system response regulator AlgR
MNILIADDEHLARQRLRALLQDLPGHYRVVGEVADGMAVLTHCSEQSVDLVLLDIRMPLQSGLQVAGQLARLNTPPAVVFVTAYDQHAVEAFERGAIDYLVKPVRLERLRQALERARALTRPQLQALQALQDSAAGAPARERICSRYRGGLECVDLDAVIYFRAEQKYVVVRHQDGQLLLEDSLKTLEEHYGQRFLRIHRNALVAAARLVGIDRDGAGRALARLRGCDDQLEISRRLLPGLRAWLQQQSPDLDRNIVQHSNM